MPAKKYIENSSYKTNNAPQFKWGFDPLLSLITLKISADEMFSEIFTNKPSLQKETIYHPKTNLYVSENKCRIEIELPGFEEKDIRFHLSKDYLILYAKNHTIINIPGNCFYLRERKTGFYIKNIPLKHTIDPENFSVIFKNGLLKISAEIKNH